MMEKRDAVRTEYLIIGNSAGGIGAAESIREVDKKGSIAIVSDEPYPAYSRPLISEYLAGERTVEEMLFRPSGFYEQNQIELLTGKKVESLDTGRRVALLKSGEKIAWKELLLATGGMTIVPKIRGLDKRGVFTFLTLDDARAIKDFAGQDALAVVIGGGLIGVSVTEALRKLGVCVTIVEMKDRVLNTILDQPASFMAEDALKAAGVDIVTGHTVSEITGGPSVEGVVLDNGRIVACSLVIVAIGVLPRTELAVDTEIKVNRGIAVDRHMAASCPGVYSCGDAAEAYDFIHGANRVIPIWPNAYVGGRVAGYNMAGLKTEYPGGTPLNSLKYFGLDITSAGRVTPQDVGDCEVLTDRRDGFYRKIVLNDGRIVGMVFIKDIEKSGMIFGLMRERVSVTGFKEALLSDDFGLAYFPAEKRRERLGARPAVPARAES